MKELELKNPMAVPRLNKIVVNMGRGRGNAEREADRPSGQRVRTDHWTEAGGHAGERNRSRLFKVREGMPIGAMVTLRGDRMYEFFDRL